MKGLRVFCLLSLLILLFLSSIAGCGQPSLSPTPTEETYNPIIDPANFAAEIDNPYFPLKPGTTFVYRGVTEDSIERNEVYVTHQTKKILGVTCMVVRDTVWDENDDLVEDTFDWYAQDKDGNVWPFGEG